MAIPARNYRISALRTLAHAVIGLLPACWREPAAELLLRRAGSPAPAAEHVFQYLLSRRRKGREAKVAQGADYFYERQYRQFLNPTMGAFAQTATQALVASGGPLEGRLWRRHRRTFATLLEQRGEAPPILVLNRETVAVALLLPRPKRSGEAEQASGWLAGSGPMPAYFRDLMAGTEIGGAEPRVRMRETAAAGATLATLDAVLATRRLAVLALHPHDPDAMGLHITLFGVDALAPDDLLANYGLEASLIAPYRYEARRADRALVFCVGATEEVFTQCSQNLFVKRPAPLGSHRPPRDPLPPLDDFVARQFEAIQVTVSASGLPGASPRNGDLGRAVFVARRGDSPQLLIPYHPGNAVHGHAAKLWSNPYGSLVLSDDHDTLCRLTVSGPARVIDHATAAKRFPDIVAQVAAQRGHNGKPATEPEYWFVQEVAELCRQREPLAANILDPARPTCTISAGGQALHGKKPGYFNAEGLAPYDVQLQHRREAAGRQEDPSGAAHRQWRELAQDALEARREHLNRLPQPPQWWDRPSLPGLQHPPRPPAAPSPPAPTAFVP